MNCPKCKALLDSVGQIDVEGQTWFVYQCDHCRGEWELDGESFPVVFTFAVDPQGRLFDPDNLERLNLN